MSVNDVVKVCVNKNGFQVQTSDYVELIVTTVMNQKSIPLRKRFAKNITIAELKQRLEIITGMSAANMSLSLLTNDNQFVCKMSDAESLLGSYPILPGMQLYVEDPSYKNVEDEEIENRFRLTTEEYDSKKGTLKDYLMRNKLGKYNPDFISKELEEAEKLKQLEAKEVEKMLSIQIGQRCEVTVPHKPKRRGVVMYKGNVGSEDGARIGVKYDEPFGVNDGTVNGIRYFEASKNYGAFVKPSMVQIGDFPPLQDGLESDDEF